MMKHKDGSTMNQDHIQTRQAYIYKLVTLCILACLLCMISMQGFAATAAESGMAYLEKISYLPMAGSGIQVELTFSQPVKAPKAFSTKQPPRVVLDFFNVGDKLAQKKDDVDQGVLRSIEAMHAGNRTRLVFDLTEHVSYETSISGNKVYVNLINRAETKLSGKKAATPQKVLTKFGEEVFVPNGWTKTSRHSLTGIDFRRDQSGGGQVVVSLSDASMGVDVKQRGQNIYVKFLDTSLPKYLQRRLDVTDFGTPVQTIETKGKGHNVEMVVSSQGLFQHLAYQVNNEFIVDVNPETKAEAEGRKKEQPKYTGERLSLNFQDISVRAVLQLLAEFTGINIVASDSVKGNMTLRLNNVPWDEALAIILRTQGLAKRKIGSVLLVAPAEEIAAREKEELSSQKEIEELEPLQTELIHLNFAKAADMAALLKDQSTSLLSQRGAVSTDVRTNTLLVQDTAQKLVEARNLIQRLDIPVKQVLIEARIVNVDTDFEKDLGISFGITKPTHVSGTITGANTMNTAFADGSAASEYIAATEAAVANRLNINLPATIDGVQAPSFGVALARLGKGYLLDLELSAVESEGGGEIVSSPRLVTANEQEAYIEQGEEIPYQEATSSGATSVEFKKAVLGLRVTPQITPDGHIIMNLKVNQDRRSSGEEVLGVPAIDTQQIETQVLVDNGQTIVLGGVYIQNKQHRVQRVPFLGELPVVGNLFRNTRDQKERRELLIFITPKIIQQTPTS